MSFNPLRTDQVAVERLGFDEGLRQHMLRVYNMMGLGVGLTGLVAWFVANTPALYSVFYGAMGKPTILGIIAIFSPLAFMFFFSFAAMRASLVTLQGMFWLFCGLMGLSMANIFAYFSTESIARAFFISAAMFGATSLYGYVTKTDLSRMGGFLTMGLIGIIIASIVNIFMASSALQFAVSVAGVLIFTGMTAWDTQRIKQTYAESYGQESNGKIAVFSALSLYLNFVNLFQFMLQFVGGRRD